MQRNNTEQLMSSGQRVTPNIVFCADGKYRWIYAMDLFKNPTVFWLVWKILFFIFFGIMVFIVLLDGFQGYLDDERLLEYLRVFGIGTLALTALTASGYLLYAAIMGGKYIVLFEMDEQGVLHKQIPSQAKKAKKIAKAAMFTGLATGKFSTFGAGAAASRTEMYSSFKNVRKVKPCPRRHLIKVNERLNHNQVYAAKEDFDFVLRFITERVAG